MYVTGCVTVCDKGCTTGQPLVECVRLTCGCGCGCIDGFIGCVTMGVMECVIGCCYRVCYIEGKPAVAVTVALMGGAPRLLF